MGGFCTLMDEQVDGASRSGTRRFRPFGLLLDFATPFECCVAHSSGGQCFLLSNSPRYSTHNRLLHNFTGYTEYLLIAIFIYLGVQI
jgi:hypothetical protein